MSKRFEDLERLAKDITDAESEDDVQETVKWALNEIEQLRIGVAKNLLGAVKEVRKQIKQNKSLESDVSAAVFRVLDVYNQVATGETRGAGGCFYADGKATLSGLQIDIQLIEDLAKVCGRTVHPRVRPEKEAAHAARHIVDTKPQRGR